MFLQPLNPRKLAKVLLIYPLYRNSITLAEVASRNFADTQVEVVHFQVSSGHQMKQWERPH
jgi:hypothetical protein